MVIQGKKEISGFVVQTNDIPSDEVIKSLIESASTHNTYETLVFMINGDEYRVTKISDNIWRVMCCSTERDCLFFIGKEL